jgi:hypothetical protein
MECLRMDPPDDPSKFSGFKKKGGRGDGWQENRYGDEQTLTFTNQHDEGIENDFFT